jgi:starch-binding outer membrane protein SusE/F
MKKNIFIYLAFIGLISLLSSCEKDETKVVMLEDPIPPTLESLPAMSSLQRSNGAVMLSFAGKPVDPGFQASATYFLEACLHGNNFADVQVIYTGVQDTLIKIATSELNGLLLKKFPADQTSSADFRIRAVLIVDAGTGAPGTSAAPFVYTSAVTTVSVKPYGFPRLDLINSGLTQKIESPLGDGKYSGLVKLDVTKPFTLKDPETNTVYGTNGAALAVNGAEFTPGVNGWHKLTVNTTALTYKLDENRIGLVGSATPNGWDAPDQKMEYNTATGTWDITIDLVAGDIKFRLNDAWAWNLGGTTDNLTHNGANITVAAGNYTIKLTITVFEPLGSEAGTYTIKKN